MPVALPSVPPPCCVVPLTVTLSPAVPATEPPSCTRSPVIARVPVPSFVSTVPPAFTVSVDAATDVAFTSPVTSTVLPPATASAFTVPPTALPSAPSVSVVASMPPAVCVSPPSKVIVLAESVPAVVSFTSDLIAPVADSEPAAATSTLSRDFKSMSPSVAFMSPATATLPAAVALTDLPWRSLPEATDSCFGETMTSEPAFFKPPTFTLPAATTPSLKNTFPSVATSRSPARSTDAPSVVSSSNVTAMSSSDEKSLTLIVTVPPSTLSTTSFPPAAIVVRSALNVLPPCTDTFFPSSVTPAALPPGVHVSAPSSYATPLNDTPFATETSPIMSPSCGIDMSASGVPALISDSRVSLLARFAAATPNNPATFTWAPFMNETPAGLNTHTLPFAFSVPAICEALPPLTTL